MTFIPSCPLNINTNYVCCNSFTFGILSSDLSISGDGKVIAYSSPGLSRITGETTGTIQIFNRENISDSWSFSPNAPHGTIVGEGFEDGNEVYFGYTVKLNHDGTTLAVLSRPEGLISEFGGTSDGKIRVFDWNGSSWVERPAISGQYVGMTMSQDGSVIAAIRYVIDHTGHVELFSWSNNSWSQMGSVIRPNSMTGTQAMSSKFSLNYNGTVFAIGTSTIGVHVYSYNSSLNVWTELNSNPALDSVNSIKYQIRLDSSGSRLAIADKWIITSRIQVFDYKEGTWSQVGSTIFQPDFYNIIAQTFQFGHNMDMNGDGDLIIAGHHDLYNFSPQIDGILHSYKLIDGEWQQDKRYITPPVIDINQNDNLSFSIKAVLSYDSKSISAFSLPPVPQSDLIILHNFYDAPTISKSVIVNDESTHSVQPGDLLFEVFIPFSMSCRYKIEYTKGANNLIDCLELRGRFFYLKSKPPEFGSIRVTVSSIEDPELSFSRYYFLNTTYAEVICQPFCVDGSGSIYDINVLSCQADPACDCESLGEILNLNLSELPISECQ